MTHVNNNQVASFGLVDFMLNRQTHIIYHNFEPLIHNNNNTVDGQLTLTIIPSTRLSPSIPFYLYTTTTTLSTLHSTTPALLSLNTQLYRNYILNGIRQQDHSGEAYEYEFEINDGEQVQQHDNTTFSPSVKDDDDFTLNDTSSTHNIMASAVFKLYKLMGTSTRVPVLIAEFALQAQLADLHFYSFVNTLMTHHEQTKQRISDMKLTVGSQRDSLKWIAQLRACSQSDCSLETVKKELLERMCSILNTHKQQIEAMQQRNQHLKQQIAEKKREAAEAVNKKRKQNEETESDSEMQQDTEDELSGLDDNDDGRSECVTSASLPQLERAAYIEKKGENQHTSSLFSIPSMTQHDDFPTLDEAADQVQPAGHAATRQNSTLNNSKHPCDASNAFAFALPNLLNHFALPIFNADRPRPVVRKRARFQPADAVTTIHTQNNPTNATLNQHRSESTFNATNAQLQSATSVLRPQRTMTVVHASQATRRRTVSQAASRQQQAAEDILQDLQ